MAIEPTKFQDLKEGRGMTSLRARERMIKYLSSKGIKEEAVLNAIFQVPRHLFIEEALAHRAYEDTPLPISAGQTISSPYIVALMTQTLLQGAVPDEFEQWNVLEIGTGSGYQAAVLSHLVARVYSLERIRALKIKAAQRIRQLSRNNCIIKHADGSIGLENKAPFDAILVTAAAPQIPEALLPQLKVGARLVIPLGETQQELHCIERTETGYDDRMIAPVRFVPFLEGSVF